MTAIPTWTIHCDGRGCRAAYSNPRMRAVTAAEGRSDAKSAGWTRPRRGGRLVDLCPDCTRKA